MAYPASATAPEGIRLTWLGTAGFLIEWGGARFAVDPYLSRPPEARPAINIGIDDLLPLDALLITHGHFDHAEDAEAIARAAACPVYAPKPVIRKLEKAGYPLEFLHPNETTPGFRIGEVSVRVVSSRHIRFNPALVATIAGRVIRSFRTLEVLRLGLGYPLGSDSDFLASYGGVSVYLSGSAGFGEETLRGLHADVALLPYAGRSDMLPVFRLALKMLEPAVLVPQHFDEFYPGFAPLGDLETLREFLAREYPQIRMVIPPPGVPFTINLEK
jgi:L-ascorbate metabolism protein UlaG (beta-lactamase superfamily)